MFIHKPSHLYLRKNFEVKAQRLTLAVNRGIRCSGRKPQNDLGEQASCFLWLVQWVIIPPPSPEQASKQPKPHLPPPGLCNRASIASFNFLISRGPVCGSLKNEVLYQFAFGFLCVLQKEKSIKNTKAKSSSF